MEEKHCVFARLDRFAIPDGEINSDSDKINFKGCFTAELNSS